MIVTQKCTGVSYKLGIVFRCNGEYQKKSIGEYSKSRNRIYNKTKGTRLDSKAKKITRITMFVLCSDFFIRHCLAHCRCMTPDTMHRKAVACAAQCCRNGCVGCHTCRPARVVLPSPLVPVHSTTNSKADAAKTHPSSGSPRPSPLRACSPLARACTPRAGACCRCAGALCRGHPECHFCQKRYYDVEALLQHLYADHLQCPLCSTGYSLLLQTLRAPGACSDCCTHGAFGEGIQSVRTGGVGRPIPWCQDALPAVMCML